MAGSRIPDVTSAAFTALAADSTLTTLLGGTSKVYSHVPENTESPYLWVLGGFERLWALAMRDETGREADVDCEVWSSYRGTKQVDDIAHQVLVTLTEDSPWSGVSGYAGVRFVQSDRPQLQFIDGQMWFMRRVTVRVFLE